MVKFYFNALYICVNISRFILFSPIHLSPILMISLWSFIKSGCVVKRLETFDQSSDSAFVFDLDF